MSVHTPDLDVTDVLDDPDFRDDTLKVKRNNVQPDADGTANELAGWSDLSGVVRPSGGDDLVQTPEGDYVKGDITVITRLDLSAGGGESSADLVLSNGVTYRVRNARPWRYGQTFTEAVCTQVELNPSSVIEPDGCGYIG